MNSHISANLLGVKDKQQRLKGRGTRSTLNGALWSLQVLGGFFFAGSGFGKVLLYDGSLYAAAPRAVAWYAAVPQLLIVFIGCRRSRNSSFVQDRAQVMGQSLT